MLVPRLSGRAVCPRQDTIALAHRDGKPALNVALLNGLEAEGLGLNVGPMASDEVLVGGWRP
jgi:hypothetical protein